MICVALLPLLHWTVYHISYAPMSSSALDYGENDWSSPGFGTKCLNPCAILHIIS